MCKGARLHVFCKPGFANLANICACVLCRLAYHAIEMMREASPLVKVIVNDIVEHVVAKLGSHVRGVKRNGRRLTRVETKTLHISRFLMPHLWDHFDPGCMDDPNAKFDPRGGVRMISV